MDCAAQHLGNVPKNPLQCIPSISISDTGRFHSRFRWVGSFVSHPCSLGTQDAAADDAARIPFAEPGQASKGKKRVLSPLTRKNFCAQVDSP
jgi:hypothetical protein